MSTKRQGSVLGTVQIVLIVLKCFELISWPWIMVLIPAWILIGVVVLGILNFIFMRGS